MMDLSHFSPRESYWKSGTYATLLRIYTHCQSYAYLFDNPKAPSLPRISANERTTGSSENDVNQSRCRFVNGNDSPLVGGEGCEEPRKDEISRGEKWRGLEDVNNMMLEVDADISSEGNAECCAQQELMEELENALLGCWDSNSDGILDALPQKTDEEQIVASMSDTTGDVMGPKSNNTHGESEEGQVFDLNNGARGSCSSIGVSNMDNTEKHTVGEDDNLHKRKLLVYEDVVTDGGTNGQHISVRKTAKKPRKKDSSDQNPDSVNKGRVRQARGPISEESKEKRKRKLRMKRAAKLREQGVKRLEIKPAKAPKRVCRHFLNGRCQEKENCKFSHDAVPLTKSKPCCHLATNSCLKGDSCPYDHQLFRYPCLSFSTKGYCSRGKSCLFSHDVANKTDDAPVGNVPTLPAPDNKRLCSPQISNPKLASSATIDLLSEDKSHVPQPQSFKPPSRLGGINFLALCKPKTLNSTKEHPISTTNDVGNKSPFPLGSHTENTNPYSLNTGATTDHVGKQNKDFLSPNSAQWAMMSMKVFAARIESTMKPI